MCRSMVDIRSTAAEIRRGKKRRRRRRKKERNYRAKIYMVSLLHRATIMKERKKERNHRAKIQWSALYNETLCCGVRKGFRPVKMQFIGRDGLRRNQKM